MRNVKSPWATIGQPQACTSEGVLNPRRVSSLQMEPGKPASSRELCGLVVMELSTYTV